jgi:hypothetical protein
MAAFRVHTRDWCFSNSDTQDYCKKLEGRAISFLDPFMPNDVRGYGSVWSEKEKIGVLQAGVAMLLRTAVGATACDGARRREEKGFGLARDGETNVGDVPSKPA